MRGHFRDQGGLFSYVSPETRVPARHPQLIISALARACVKTQVFTPIRFSRPGCVSSANGATPSRGGISLLRLHATLRLTHQLSARGSKPPISQPACHGATGSMRMPEDQISRLRLPLWTSIGKAEPSP
jgi:hypothetical protein